METCRNSADLIFVQKFFKPLPDFIDTVLQTLLNDGVDVSLYELDHICYRVASISRYDEVKLMLHTMADQLSEAQISGRSIATFKLYAPILFLERSIWVVEVPSPKLNSRYVEGFEHIEFVIDQSFDAFMEQYAHLTFDVKDMHIKINPDIRLQYDGFSVKFHHASLEDVIRYEQK